MNNNILYLAFAPIIKGNGVAKKIMAQRKAFMDLGNNVVFCHFSTEGGETYAKLDDKRFYYLGGKLLYQFRIFTFFERLSKYVRNNKFDAIYIRYEKNASAGFIRFLRSLEGVCPRIMEIPTYPYDNETHSTSVYRRLRLWEERHYRAKFSNCVDTIVTFSDDTTIFGVKTLRISNAVDSSTICLREYTSKTDYDVSLIGVANLAFWHGYDRVLLGMKKYFEKGGKKKIQFRIVGEGDAEERARLEDIVRNNHLEKAVSFHGNKSGKELDDLFNQSDFAVGSLGRHRSGIGKLKTLKNVEYAMRGIPFMYSELNEDFDEKPYILKVPADDTPIDIEGIFSFITHLNQVPLDIRKDVSHLTWYKQMEKVCMLFNKDQ